MPNDYAASYERDFGFFKDYSREAVFLDLVFKTYGMGVARVLDIACGPGSHIVELARMGYRCAAADIDPEMLARTRDAGAEHDLAIETHVADLRNFRLSGRFDAALNMFYSFQNVLFAPPQQLSFFQSVAALLAPGGLFIIELLPEENNLRLYPPGESFVTHRAVQEDGSTLTVTSTSRIIDETRKDIVFLYETVLPDGTFEHEELISPIRRVYLAQFEALCAAAGLARVAAFGACDPDVPFTDDSARLVAVLKKG
ncbi:MAG: class I SAM-dependent methyltransferase [Methylacidiphilales bacterium]|nr:class I SAM-dependent methyltransferase [Candidatus Methylacidiphilales bacterium]